MCQRFLDCIRDLIAALGCEYYLIGIRPGEKSTDLISEDESTPRWTMGIYFFVNGTFNIPCWTVPYQKRHQPDLNIDGLRGAQWYSQPNIEIIIDEIKEIRANISSRWKSLGGNAMQPNQNP